jgi:hypothetical protein
MPAFGSATHREDAGRQPHRGPGRNSDDAANHGTESYVLTVADYGGKAVRNYLYGPVIAWTYGTTGRVDHLPGAGTAACCSTVKPFEYGGGYALAWQAVSCGWGEHQLKGRGAIE